MSFRVASGQLGATAIGVVHLVLHDTLPRYVLTLAPIEGFFKNVMEHSELDPTAYTTLPGHYRKNLCVYNCDHHKIRLGSYRVFS